MDSFVLFSGSKRITLRPEDMTTEKISVIFQVQKETIYLTDDTNVAIFSRNDGDFASFDLTPRGHYEVHGDRIAEEKISEVPQSGQPVRFSFHRPSSTATNPTAPISRSTTKTFTRSVFIAEVLNGKLETSKMVTVRFSEFEASVAPIAMKVKEALGQQDSFVLTDSQGNRICDSDGTRGSAFWKQSTRKIFAVPEEQMELLQVSKRRRLSRREDTGFQDVIANIEEVVEAAQGLKDVSQMIREFSGFTRNALTTTLSLSEAEVTTLKMVFACLVCTGPVKNPMFSTCCRSLIGCRLCIEKWIETHSYCPKCRCGDVEDNIHEVSGLSDALAPLEKLFQ